MIEFARQQAQEARSIARSVVAAAMQRAMKEIEYWLNVNIMDVIDFIPPVQLVPSTQTEILEHARKISVEGAAHLSGVFDNLLYAERELTILQRRKIKDPQVLRRHGDSANEFLKFAFVDLQAA